ncbi:MAG: hypothetical protein ACRDZ4_21115 [Egibacteraceae bacterium]
MTTSQALSAPTLEDAAAEILFRLASTEELMVVVGRDPGPAGRCIRDCPERVVVAPGVTGRFAVADGVWIGGSRVVTVLEDRLVDLVPAAGCGHPNVLLTTHAAHLATARDAGLVVVQPGWPGDVEPLLRDALAAPEPVLIRLHACTAQAPEPEQPPELDSHRVLRRGRAGLLVAAGAGAPLLVHVAAALTARAVNVTAVEMHTIRPSTGVDPARTDSVLLVGAAGVEDASQLVGVPFGSGSVSRLTDAVLEVLPR